MATSLESETEIQQTSATVMLLVCTSQALTRLPRCLSYFYPIWLAIRKKGLSDIYVKCRLGSACAIRAG